MGYMFRLLFESSSGPQNVDPDIPTFTALCGPQRLQNKTYIIKIYKMSVLMVHGCIKQRL